QDIYPPARADKYWGDDQRVLTTGEIYSGMEVEQETSEKRVYLAAVKVPVYGEDKKIVGLQGGLWDVTERVWAEGQKEQLEIARAIQEQLLPRTAPRVPGLDIAGASFPADATGGDYYDFLALRDGELGVVIGDVSGHGFGPALLAAVTHACFHTLTLA